MNYNHLKTIRNFAKKFDITPQYIYKLIGEGKIIPIIIDGMKFIDEKKYSKFLTDK